MNTCDHYSYVKTKTNVESLKTCLVTCACDPYNLYGDQASKPGLQISRKYRKHMSAFQVCLGLLMVVMIAGIHISQELFGIDMLTALKSS